MNRPTLLSLGVLVILAVAATGGGGADHSHDPSEDAHQHASPPEGGAEPAGHGADDATVAVTQWTDSMELFMEYPLVSAGEPGRFIIHLTVLEGFQPVRAGAVTLRFQAADGTRHEFETSELLREGIFAPTVRLEQPGPYELDLLYNGPNAIAGFHIHGFRVFASPAVVPAASDMAAGDEIGFLKEQQWKIPFATSTVETREIKRGVWAIGQVLPAPLGYAEIASPIEGVIQASQASDLALPGSQVRRGDTVATLAPPLGGSGFAGAQLAFAQAERNFERAQRLVETDAISKRAFEEARNEYLAQKAGYERLAGRGADGVLKLTAPIDGQIVDWNVRPGQRVRAGDKLMAVADPSVVWLQVNVYEQDFRGLGRPTGLFVNTESEPGGWTVPASDMRVLTTGGALDPVTRTVPILLEIDNPAGLLTINESAPVELYGADGASAVAVLREAVYKDEGLDVVFVQTGGESFVKRIVTVGPYHAGWVSILDGLEPGDRVVTRGGYHVKLASTSAEVGHGHAH